MALGDQFPTELVNTTDFAIERPGFNANWSDDVGVPTSILSGVSAIVVPQGGSLLTRDVSGQEVATQELAILPPNIISIPEEKDRATWTDVFGVRQDREVVSVQRLSGIDGYESVVLSLGHRTA